MDYEDEDGASGPGFLDPIEQKEKEELEFYTDLAVQEMQRWIEVGIGLLSVGVIGAVNNR